MSDFTNATEAASLAVRFDQTGQVDKAVECYRTAARLLDRVCDHVPPEKQIEIRKKVKEYLERATFLQEQKGTSSTFYSFIAVNSTFFLYEPSMTHCNKKHHTKRLLPCLLLRTCSVVV